MTTNADDALPLHGMQIEQVSSYTLSSANKGDPTGTTGFLGVGKLMSVVRSLGVAFYYHIGMPPGLATADGYDIREALSIDAL